MKQSVLSRVWRQLSGRRRTSTDSQQAIFTEIVGTKAWGDVESVSGPGSTRARGADFRDELVALLDRWHVRSIVDAPCGDFNWMRDVLALRDLSYTGVDIVEDLILRNNDLY